MQNDARRVAALAALAEAGVPVDVQEFLLRNNAIDKAIAAAVSTDAGPVASWAMTDLEKGRYYESVHFGLVEYLGRDVFHGQTTAKFETGRRDICRFQYILPKKLGDFLKPKAPGALALDGDDRTAVSLGASVLAKIADPSVREAAIRNALTTALNRPAQVQDVAGLQLRPHEPTKEALARALKAESDLKTMRDRYERWMPVTDAPPAGLHPDSLLSFYCISDEVQGDESPEYWRTETWAEKPADAIYWCAIVSPLGPHETTFAANASPKQEVGE